MPPSRDRLTCHCGTDFKTLFTNSRRRRYDWIMLWIAAATAIAISNPQGAPRLPTSASVQARAMVRIVTGARIRFGDSAQADVPAARERWIRSDSGIQAAKLIEFE